jgi:hypothetical protein
MLVLAGWLGAAGATAALHGRRARRCHLPAPPPLDTTSQCWTKSNRCTPTHGNCFSLAPIKAPERAGWSRRLPHEQNSVTAQPRPQPGRHCPRSQGEPSAARPSHWGAAGLTIANDWSIDASAAAAAAALGSAQLGSSHPPPPPRAAGRQRAARRQRTRAPAHLHARRARMHAGCPTAPPSPLRQPPPHKGLGTPQCCCFIPSLPQVALDLIRVAWSPATPRPPTPRKRFGSIPLPPPPTHTYEHPGERSPGLDLELGMQPSGSHHLSSILGGLLVARGLLHHGHVLQRVEGFRVRVQGSGSAPPGWQGWQGMHGGCWPGQRADHQLDC